MAIMVLSAFPQLTVWFARKNGKSWPIFAAPADSVVAEDRPPLNAQARKHAAWVVMHRVENDLRL
jgi:hypothetical protein